MSTSPRAARSSSARRQLFAVIATFCLLFQQSVLVVSAQISAKRSAAEQRASVTPRPSPPPDPSFSNPTSTVFINEILYDITGTDAGEFVEVAAPAGTNMANYSIVLYNGSGGAVYDTDALSGTTTDQQGGYGFVSVSYPSNGIQNGAPDGIALINTSTNTLVQFLCYEGTFAGVGGLANGVTCTDIGVSQPGTNAAGTSLQLQGTGTTYGNFTWNATSIAQTQNLPNTGQTFTGGGGGTTLNINDVTQAEGATGTSTFTFTVSLTQPAGVGGVSFDIATADGTAQDDNPAAEDNDYVANSLTGQTILAGSSTYTFDVTVNGDTTPEPNETFFVNVTNITGANAGDAQGQGTITNDDVTVTSICQIQGNGNASPFPNGTNLTTDGVVTGRKSNGFFMQQDACDADTETSDGIFVFTSSAPPAAAAIGNRVRVTGTLSEFVPSQDLNQNPLTELTSPTVSLLATGQPLPAPVVLDAAETTNPSEVPGEPLDTLEEYEGMRVSVASFTVVAPTHGNIDENDATSTSNGVFYGVVTGVARPFREPGIALSDPVPTPNPPNVPRFDENPERLRVDSDALGAPVIDVTTGTVITNITGPLDYGFRTYTINPDAATPPTVGTLATFTAVPVPNADEFTVASFNAFHFFDTNDDPGVSDVVLTPTAFNNRLNKISLVIRNVMRTPDVIGVQEFDNLGTLQAVATKVNNDAVAAGDPNPNYVAFLVEGNDIGSIDVGFLVKSSRVTVFSVTQEGKTATFTNPNTGQQELLNDRPPLVLRATIARPTGGTLSFTVIVSHLRSLIDVEGDNDPGRRARAKRQAGAEFLANLIQTRQTADPTERIISVGDMNAFQFNDGYADVIGTIKGTPSPDDQTVVPGDGADLVNPDLTDLVDTLTPDQRYSYTFDGNAQVLDHILVNDDALAIKNRFAYARNNADFPTIYYGDPLRPERISDHDMPVAYFSLGAPQPSGSFIVSEYRLRGSGFGGQFPVRGRKSDIRRERSVQSGFFLQENDEFIEFYNNTDSPITVQTVDGSAGWSLVASDGITRFTILNGTVIPARGHYLATNQFGYSLSNYPGGNDGINETFSAGDITYSLDIADGSGIAIFNTSNPANFDEAHRLDAVGYSANPQLYREGNGFNSATPGPEIGGNFEYSFLRDLRAGTHKDTNDNAADFLGIDTLGRGTTIGTKLGAPGPENLFSPIRRLGMLVNLLDPSAAQSSAPNRVRDLTKVLPNGTNGTISIRRTVINNTGGPVTRLRFRIKEITTLTSPPVAGQADIRALSSGDITVTVNGTDVPVQGTVVEAPPPFQPDGGGWNTSWSPTGTINLASPLPAGASINVQFLVGVERNGSFRIFINLEALP